MKKLFVSLMVLGSVLAGSAAIAQEKAAPADANTAQTHSQAATFADKLNINTANADEIQKGLIGIGAKKAEAIVQYREKHGNFTAAEQLLEVQGIGQATLEKNKERIIF